MANRKGAARVSDVSPDVLAQLQAGEIETATLSETLAMDFAATMRATLPELADLTGGIIPKDGVTKRMAQAAQIIFDHSGMAQLDLLQRHRSDLLRGWGAYLLALDETRDLEAKIEAMRPFADDAHFGVREWAWLALRPAIVAEPERAIACLTHWTTAASENLRRFASEATRPRGVWAAHIKLFKEQPARGLAVLAPLRADPARYVQDSVANWLNDAWKSQPEWVEALCAEWTANDAGDATLYIVKRALRNRK